MDDEGVVKFVIDSGATNHLVKMDLECYFENSMTINHNINVAKEGECIKAEKKGNLKLQMEDGCNVTIKNALACRNLFRNLLSVRKLEEQGCQVLFKEKKVHIMRRRKILVTGNLEGNLYIITLRIPEYLKACSVNEDITMMHRRMGHSSKFPVPHQVCEVCVKAKQTRNQFTPLTEDRKAKRILEVVSTDVCGPIKPATYDGKNYYVTFIDHYSHFCVVHLIEKKSEVYRKFQNYFQRIP